jgi:hypothetical protein
MTPECLKAASDILFYVEEGKNFDFRKLISGNNKAETVFKVRIEAVYF